MTMQNDSFTLSNLIQRLRNQRDVQAGNLRALVSVDPFAGGGGNQNQFTPPPSFSATPPEGFVQRPSPFTTPELFPQQERATTLRRLMEQIRQAPGDVQGQSRGPAFAAPTPRFHDAQEEKQRQFDGLRTEASDIRAQYGIRPEANLKLLIGRGFANRNVPEEEMNARVRLVAIEDTIRALGSELFPSSAGQAIHRGGQLAGLAITKSAEPLLRGLSSLGITEEPPDRFEQVQAVSAYRRGDIDFDEMVKRSQDALNAPPGVVGGMEVVGSLLLPPFGVVPFEKLAFQGGKAFIRGPVASGLVRVPITRVQDVGIRAAGLPGLPRGATDAGSKFFFDLSTKEGLTSEINQIDRQINAVFRSEGFSEDAMRLARSPHGVGPGTVLEDLLAERALRAGELTNLGGVTPSPGHVAAALRRVQERSIQPNIIPKPPSNPALAGPTPGAFQLMEQRAIGGALIPAKDRMAVAIATGNGKEITATANSLRVLARKFGEDPQDWLALGRADGAKLKDAAAGVREIIPEASRSRRLEAMGLDAGGAADDIPSIVPSESLLNLGDLPFETGLSTRRELWQTVLRTLGLRNGLETDADRLIRPVMENLRKKALSHESIGTVHANKLRATFRGLLGGDLVNGNSMASLRGIDPTLGDAIPSIADIAARFPRFAPHLTSEVRAAFLQLRDTIAPFTKALDDVGRFPGIRDDIMDGGFYVPRGNATADGFEAPVRLAGRGGGKRGFERPAPRASQGEGILMGDTYPPFEDALKTFIKGVGDITSDEYLKNFFRALEDPGTGLKLGQSAADRVDPGLRAAIESLRARIAGRRITIGRGIGEDRAFTQAGKVTEKFAEGVSNRAVNVARMMERMVERETTEQIFANADGMLNVLEREAVRAGAAADKIAAKGAATGERLVDRGAALDALREELRTLLPKWKNAQKVAAGVPRGQSTLGVPGLESLSFPDALANATKRILREQSESSRLIEAPILATVNALNNTYRGLRATADNSYPGIQGLLGIAGDLKSARSMLRVNLASWVDSDVLGAFLKDFDLKATRTGRLSSSDWATRGVRVGGAETEYQLGAGLGSRIKNLPGIRQANRAFGNAGDAQRLSWADDMLSDELASRSLDDIIKSGDIDRIGAAVNRMTGYVEGKAFGSMGDLLLFAPRFFQSRVETVAKAGQGLLPGAKLDARKARASVLRLIGGGTLVTFGVNEMLGNETDFRTVVDGKWNPNFMRIRWGGRDWSVFGTWDSLARLMVNAGSGAGQADPGLFFSSFRGMSSGIVSSSWDWLTNEDFIGRSVRDNPGDMAQWFAEHLTPFSFGELPGIAAEAQRAVEERDPARGGFAAVTLIGEVWGSKSSPMGFGDTRDIISIEKYGIPFKGVKSDGQPLSSSERKAVNDDPRATEFTDRFAGQTATPREQATQAFLAYDTVVANQEKEILEALKIGKNGPDLRRAVSAAKTAIFQVQQTVFNPLDIKDLLQRDKEATVDTLRLEYRFVNTDYPEDPFGNPDFAQAERDRKAVLVKADIAGIPRKSITETKRKFEDNQVEHLFQTLELINHDLLSDFYALEVKAVGTSPESRVLWQEYRSKSADERTAFKEEHPVVRGWEADIREGRENLRLDDRLVDAIRNVYWGSTPIHPANDTIFRDEGPEALDAWLAREISRRMSDG